MLEFAYSSQKRFVRVEICPKKKTNLIMISMLDFRTIYVYTLQKKRLMLIEMTKQNA